MLDYPLDLIARVLDARVASADPAANLSDIRVRRVSTDSRTVHPGDLFVAIAGENFDGHAYVKTALDAGAAAALVAPDRVTGVGPLLEVPDPLLALGTLGAWHRNRHQVTVVGVTGSVGKTTTKDLLHSVLSQAGPTLKNPGNLNAEIGVPLTLLEIRPEHRFAVVEMAMRGPGQIRYLARLARPDVALITFIGLSHMELLGSQDAIAAAKAEILDFLPLSGTAVLNAADRYFPFLSGQVHGARILPFALSEILESEGVFGRYLGCRPCSGSEGGGPLGSRYEVRLGDGTCEGWLPLLGRHNVSNALAAAAVGDALGLTAAQILRGLAIAEVSGSRMACRPLSDGSLLLDDAYNASTPEAMIGALEVLHEMDGPRKIALLGSMLELGPSSEAAHQQVGEAIAQRPPQLLITVGGHATQIAASARAAGMAPELILACESKDEALAELTARRQPGDVILVKGSRGVAMETMVQMLTANSGAPVTPNQKLETRNQEPS